jgi:hypothetical protein
MAHEKGRCAFAIAVAALGLHCSNDGGASAPPADPVDAASSTKTTGRPQTCVRGSPDRSRPVACNGSATLCDRTYDRVVVPMTHNAMSNRDDGWASPNQTHGVQKQLDDGIRGMMLDIHYADPETKRNSSERLSEWSTVDQVHLCHSACLLGMARLLDSLCTITKFLDSHPGEVFTIIFENYVTDADTDEVVRASGLGEYAYTHAAGTPWPTLRSIIDSGKRVVIFVEKGGGTPATLHPAFKGNIRDTPYTFEQASQFTCKLNRGADGDPLFLVNHWLGRPLADIAFAREVNVEAVLGKRVADCTSQVRAPTFVGVDFYEVGDLMSVIARANQ